MFHTFLISEIHDQDEKSALARMVLETLPDWFGNQEALEDYVKGVRELPFWAALDKEGNCLGFFCVRIHYGHTTFMSAACARSVTVWVWAGLCMKKWNAFFWKRAASMSWWRH